MALISAKEIETNVHELEVSVDAETWNNAIDQAYEKQKKNLQLPGFRKGKAPKAMIFKQYGKEAFYNDAIDIVYPDAVDAAVAEAGLELVDAPFDGAVNEINDEGMKFTVKVTVMPEVKVGKYKGLAVSCCPSDVSDEEVDEQIKQMLDRSARYVEVDREVKNGDMTTIDFCGSVDGVEFDGGKAEEYELEIGSGSFIPGFEDQIIGHKAGDEFDVNVTFPEEYVENLAGKDAVFACKLHAVKEKQLPELDDEFAKDVSEFDTLDELKADTRKHLEEHKKEHSDQEVEEGLAKELAAIVEGEIPEVMYEHEVDESIQNFAYQIQQAGMDPDMYLQYTGMTTDDLRAQFRERAETQVKCRLALNKISELEKVEVTDDDIKASYDEMAKMYEVELDVIEKAFPKEQMAKDLKGSKALDIVKAAAKITTEDHHAEEKAPAKKAPAKKAPAKKKPAAKKADKE
ncbi:MAG: trigger factor [Clostridia bacterium]|nr:trigger factor [Clostridia bacterium]